MKRKRFSIVLPVLGATLIALSLSAEVLGMDPTPGFGPTRFLNLIVGVFLIFPGLGGYLYRSARTAPRDPSFSSIQWPGCSLLLLGAVLAVLVTALDIYLSGQLGLLSQPLRYDGVSYVLGAKSYFYHFSHQWLHRPLPLLRELFSNEAPLWRAVLLFSFMVFGEGEWQAFTVRFWPTWLLLILIGWILKRRVGNRIAYSAILLTALLPTLSVGLRSLPQEFFSKTVSFGQEWYLADLRPDLLMVALMLWAVVLLIENSKIFDRRIFFVSGIFAGLSVLAKPSALSMLMISWGTAILYVLIAYRPQWRKMVPLILWALLSFGIEITPWALSGGFGWVFYYLQFAFTKGIKLYSIPNATLFSELKYYWEYYFRHMGWVEGRVILAAGATAFAANCLKGQGDKRLWFYVTLAGLLYLLVAFTPNKNYFLGLPYYFLLWIFSWSAVAPWLSLWNRRRAAAIFLALATGMYVLGCLGAAAYAFVKWPPDERLAGPENRRVTLQIAEDLKQILSPEDFYIPVSAYGYPATLSCYLVDEKGRFPANLSPSDPTLPVEDLIKESARCKAIMVFDEAIEETSRFHYSHPLWRDYWEGLKKWLASSESHYRIYKTYRFSAHTPPFTYRLNEGERRGFTIKLYIKEAL
ncbi:MAG: hypothetical protein A3C47_00550 [Omnitrophica bacterium RIFCSPHIGHO2_02_FULL_51_18]|nr:MAG: hypothetical protein A3C47_00550 [Omnitrophica bacterium RIFCSPHIGHO2_02_FULL_51_18]